MTFLITGGAGFVGSNAVAHFLAKGQRVVALDNLGRRGTDKNLAWLQGLGGDLVVAQVDIRDTAAVDAAFQAHPDIEAVLHLAAQTAVTTSVEAPREDFEINALGTFNILEAARELPHLKALLYASTNKVYGGMEDLAVVERNGRYAYRDLSKGVAEDRPLDFHSPYGCSKGAGDQYVVDYARIYGLPTVAFRQCTIYGPRQLGVEDQGWVAWFCIAAVLGKPLTLYGDGRQVRDVLHVSDLLALYERAIERIEEVEGQVYNVGGGPTNTLSLLELIARIEERLQRRMELRFDEWRPGDQRVFIADISKAAGDLGWQPQVGVEEGVDSLLTWVQDNGDLFV
ncbi:MAG: CDP-paratose 2-epimerase [Dehalococcoidia bacterium]|nr:CDP-paratose 2-epimerase [Dehalococcoidia bacterium]